MFALIKTNPDSTKDLLFTSEFESVCILQKVIRPASEKLEVVSEEELSLRGEFIFKK